MGDVDDILEAARRRAEALAHGDAVTLTSLLHPLFRWTSHRGVTFDRHEYVRRNTQGQIMWESQMLADPAVTVVGDTGVLVAEAVDLVWVGAERETFRMPVTQVWVRADGGWSCLAGHAGPAR